MKDTWTKIKRLLARAVKIIHFPEGAARSPHKRITSDSTF